MICFRFDHESCEDNDTEIPNVDFERPINQDKEDEEEIGDCLLIC